MAIQDAPDGTVWAQMISVVLDVPKAVEIIPIDIAAASIETINVDITAQTVGNLVIDIEAQSVGVYLQPDWQAKEGKDKAFYSAATAIAYGTYAYNNYSVPGTKTLYLCGFSCELWAASATDYDHFILAGAVLNDTTAGITYTKMGGLGGCGLSFSIPLVFPGNHMFQMMVYNYSNINCNATITAWGYEI